ncbi:MAG: riboflavin biosynthesis protein RibF [Bacteroidales bacterium]|nr:riboflavin biosynthesis protein RibF [Bacteroidales bacterium]
MAVIATGFFDGIHRGHRRLIETLVQCARERSEPAIVLTFWPHPRMALQHEARQLRLLSSMEEKTGALKALGVDRVEVIEFTRDFSSLTTEQYLRDIVCGKYAGTMLVLGYDNRLGSDQMKPEETAGLAARFGLETTICEAVGRISSTSIRTALSEGNVRLANEQLGYEYSLKGVVVSGKQLGRTIGFPTANMQLYDPLKMLPGKGAYLTKVRALGKELYGMTDVGDVIETHIFDFDEDIYGLDLRISFVERLRDRMDFSSPEELKNQLAIDEVSAKNLIFGL